MIKPKYDEKQRIEDAFEAWAIMAEEIGDILSYEYIIQYLKKHEIPLFKERLQRIGVNV